MMQNYNYDVIIIGGSYAGLQACMTLGRALKKVLIIDSGAPCNRQTPHSHNFLTRDGETPSAIAAVAREQLNNYHSVEFHQDKATYGMPYNSGFEIGTLAGDTFTTKKLLFASGIKDTMPLIKGFAECWGISVLHCPYCHGYEVRNMPTGILANGDVAFEMAKLISNWTTALTIYTNGKSQLNTEQLHQLNVHDVKIVKSEIEQVLHQDGYVTELLLGDGIESDPISALYTRLPFQQHCPIPEQLGCTFTNDGLLQIDALGKTTVDGVYAAGDNSSVMRTIATAVLGGMAAGAMINREMIEARFK